MARGFRNKDGTKLGFKKGNIPWSKGKKCPQLSKALKGHIPWNKGGTSWSKGKKFSKTHRENLSKASKGKHNHKGKNNPRWKGGITPLNNQIRHSFKYRQWRSDIFTRDDFTCQKCGKKGIYIEADHYPKSFAEILREYKIKTLEEALACEELWNINGGRTLCENCHKLTKTYKK